MTDNWEDETWEDECDNVPDLLAIQEKKQKLLLEKQQMEEAENELIDDMITGNGITKTYDAKGTDAKTSCTEDKNAKKKKEKNNDTVEHKRKMAELDAKKAEQEFQRKQKKLNEKEKKRQEEMYGEAEPDEYDDKYGYIEEGYY